MSASAGENSVIGNRAQTSGWAEFDRKHRRKQLAFEREIDSEDYPSLSAPISAQTLSLLNKNKSLVEKPFSSVAIGSSDFPSMINRNDQNFRRRGEIDDLCGRLEAAVKVDDFHPRVDESLIQDCNEIDESNYRSDQTSFDYRGVPDRERPHCVGFKDDECLDPSLDSVKHLPIEPELESDYEKGDLYVIHRRDAIKMIRSASRHSKAANDAFRRGNHLSAHHFSHIAREEWTASKKLNARAAKEILMTRNYKNDPWTLDLHGLHVSEAILALHQHLRTVESLVSSNCLSSSNALNEESNTLISPSAPSLNYVKTEKFGRELRSLRHRQTLLQVTTGKGNHSQEVATLPSAIRNFLNENRYHFDETRPGVIMIRPKFRQKMATSCMK